MYDSLVPLRLPDNQYSLSEPDFIDGRMSARTKKECEYKYKEAARL